MRWNPIKPLPPSHRVSRSGLRARAFRPTIERLEPRMTPSTDLLSWRGAVAGDNSGVNANETQLNTGNVAPNSFGLLFSYPVDGSIYGEPLVKTGVWTGGARHDVVYVATEHDSVYAFDANNYGPGGGLLWHDSFINPAAGINVVPSSVTGSGDIAPEVGISNTMYIDPGTNTLFTTAKTQNMVGGVAHYVIQLHALDLATGAEKFGGPVTIGDTTIGGPDGGYTDTTNVAIPGTGLGSDGTTVRFNALRENERDGLFELHGVLYLTFTSHGDVTPVHGWILGYDPRTLNLVSRFITTPDGGLAEIWMGQGMPAVDSNGYLYASTGNGTFDAFSAPAPGPNALGPGGGGLGYGPDSPPGSNVGGIHNSMAVKFDIYSNNGEGPNSTGIFFNGDSPTTAVNPGDQSIDLTGTGIDLHSTHNFDVTLAYDNTAHTLTETITDLDGTGTFTHTYTGVDLTSQLAGNTGYVGFTGGTGGLTSTQDVKTWTVANRSGTVVDFSGGFTDHTGLTNNGSAQFTGGVARLTSSQTSQAGSVFFNTPIDVTGNFTTHFTFQITNPNADGMTFTIQNAPATPPGPDYGESIVKIAPNMPGPNGDLSIVDSFTPSDYMTLNNADTDQGSGGVLLLPDSVGSTAHPHLMVQTGKEGEVYLIDRDMLGGFNSTFDAVVQILPPGTVAGGSYDTPAYFNGNIYYMGANDVLKAFSISDGVLSTTPVAQTTQRFGFPGASPFITTDGSGDGIVWVLDDHLHGTNGAQSGPAVLHAYDANTLQELYNTSQVSTDQLGGAVKFTVPTVVNGHAYVGTQTSLAVLGRIHVRPPAVQATNICAGAITLSWTATANDHYTVERSTDGIGFTVIADNLPATQTTFTDNNDGAGLPFGTYFYRVTAVTTDADGTFSATSTPVQVTVGPVDTDHSSGFASHTDLTANGSAQFVNNVLRVTDGGASEAGSSFTTQPVGVRSFTTTFTLRDQGVTGAADGLSFVIQNDIHGGAALGGNGGGEGYSGILNSLAIKFDQYTHGTHNSSTGLFIDGQSPDSDPTKDVIMSPTINLSSGDPITVTLTYDGTTLTETVHDTVTDATFTTSYAIDIPATVGGEEALVGFTGGTGGETSIQDVQTWTYDEQEANLVPRAPTDLRVTDVERHNHNHSDVTIAWNCNNDYTATGYAIERSTNGGPFVQIATVDAGTASFTDVKRKAGLYAYRVRAFNDAGYSAYSNVDSVLIGGGDHPTVIDHSAGFGTHDDLTANGSATFAGTFDRLTDGNSGEAGSTFTNARVGISTFTTTFTFQLHDGTNPSADGMGFVIQGDPRGAGALGPSGGGLGYGPDSPTGNGTTPGVIVNSLIIKFDLFSNAGEGNDSTGLFINGDSPTIAVNPGDSNVDLTGSGIDLHSQDVMMVTLTYDGVTLTETITDTVTNASFNQSYTVDIAALLGSNVGYVGFTGGTGGSTTVADVQTWFYESPAPPSGGASLPGAPPSPGATGLEPTMAAPTDSGQGAATGSALRLAASAAGTADSPVVTLAGYQSANEAAAVDGLFSSTGASGGGLDQARSSSLARTGELVGSGLVPYGATVSSDNPTSSRLTAPPDRLGLGDPSADLSTDGVDAVLGSPTMLRDS